MLFTLQFRELEKDITRRERAFAVELGKPGRPLDRFERNLMKTRWSFNHGLDRWLPEITIITTFVLLMLVCASTALR